MMKGRSFSQKSELIYKGAEAEIRRKEYLGFPVVEKRRIRKDYRVKKLDEKIRNERIRSEVNMLVSARKAISTPHILDVDTVENVIVMEYIDGSKIKNLFDRGERLELGRKIGEQIRRLHENDLIHNDLTTSNMILKDGKIYFIDFGLGFKSKRLEDRAVDVLVFKKMLKSTHWKYFDKIWKEFCEGYKDRKVLGKVTEVEKRARYV